MNWYHAWLILDVMQNFNTKLYSKSNTFEILLHAILKSWNSEIRHDVHFTSSVVFAVLDEQIHFTFYGVVLYVFWSCFSLFSFTEVLHCLLNNTKDKALFGKIKDSPWFKEMKSVWNIIYLTYLTYI